MSELTADRPPQRSAEYLRSSLRQWWLVVVAFAVSLFLLLTGNGKHGLWDRDEPRNATASRNMIRTGNWIVPEFNGELRAHKPVLVNWTQAVALLTVGRLGADGWEEYAVRMPSAIAGAVTVAVTVGIALLMGLGPTFAALAGAIVLLSPIFLVVHKAATTDGILIACVWLAILLQILQSRDFQWHRHLLFGFVVGVSILQKGPVGPLVLALLGLVWWGLAQWGIGSVNTLTRSWSRVSLLKRWSVTVGVVLMLCLPWVIAVQVATEGAFLREAIGRHVLDRAVADQAINNQGGPLWYYVPVVVAFVLPYLPFVVTGWWMAWRRGRLGQAPLVVILGVWALVTVVVFSLFKTKLPHYILPVLPALALTAAAGLSYITRVIPARLIGAGYYLAGGLLVLGLSAVGWRYLPEPVSHLTPFLVVPAVLLGVFLLLSAYHWFSGRLLDSAASLSAGLVVVVLLLFHGLLPAMDPLRASRMVTNQVRAMGPDYELGAVGFREPSLVWNLGRNVAMFGRRRPGPALEFLLEKPGRVVLVEKRVYDEWSRDTTETLPRAVWSGTALDLQSELFTELLLLQPENK